MTYVKLIFTIVISLIVQIIYFTRKNSSKSIDFFGRKIGIKKVLNNELKEGVELFCHPMESVRYSEFNYVLSKIEKTPVRVLDVSSPRLFSIFLSKIHKQAQIFMVNPDPFDIKETQKIIQLEKVRNINVSLSDLQGLSCTTHFDLIYSISVIEHISGDIDDVRAVQLLEKLLSHGGKIILTVPVDKFYREEFVNVPLYGTQPKQLNGKYFFQRIYDYDSIMQRLIEPNNLKLIDMSWYGEKRSGSWQNYRRTMPKSGFIFNVLDPLYMDFFFTKYSSWNDMKGFGVCGLTFEKV